MFQDELTDTRKKLSDAQRSWTASDLAKAAVIQDLKKAQAAADHLTVELAQTREEGAHAAIRAREDLATTRAGLDRALTEARRQAEASGREIAAVADRLTAAVAQIIAADGILRERLR